MASAYRPRHKEKPKHQKLESLTLNTIINHPTTNKKTHIYLPQLKRTTPALPDRLITAKVTLVTPKIYTRMNTILHSKTRYTPQYTPCHIKHKYSPLQMYYTHPQYKNHPTRKPHPKQKNKNSPEPIPSPKYDFHPKYGSHPNHRPHPKHLCQQKSLSHPKPKLHPKLTYHSQYKPHPKYNTYLILNPYPKLKIHLGYKPYPKWHRRYNSYVRYKPKTYTQQNHLNLQTYQRNNYHPKHNPHPTLKHRPFSKPKSHPIYKRYPKNKMALAYRPHHKTNC